MYAIDLQPLSETEISHLFRERFIKNLDSFITELPNFIDEIFGEYQLWWSQDGNKDKDETIKFVKTSFNGDDSIFPKIGKFFTKKYKSAIQSSEASTIYITNVITEHKKIINDTKLEKNTRIRFAFQQNYSPTTIAEIMGVKTQRVSVVYSN